MCIFATDFILGVSSTSSSEERLSHHWKKHARTFIGNFLTIEYAFYFHFLSEIYYSEYPMDSQILGRKTRGIKANQEVLTIIRRLKERGMTYSEIGEIMGTSGSAVQQRIRLKGYPKGKAYGICPKCGKEGKLSGHHTSYINNTGIFICGACHSREHAAPLYEAVKVVLSTAVNGSISYPMVKDKMTRGLFYRAIKQAGVKHKRGGTKMDWSMLNWDFPNKVLAEVWGLNVNYLSRVRKNMGIPLGKLRPYFHGDPKPLPREISDALEQHKEFAEKFKASKKRN